MRRHAELTAALVAGLCCQAILASGAAAVPQATTTTGLCPTPPPLAAAADAHDVHSGAWSYFGDPRALAHGTRIFTGCVSTTRGIVTHQYDLRNGETLHAHLHRNKELDDHDNPSLVFWRHRIYAFYSPHSGRFFPLDRHSEMHYRASRAPYDLHAGFGPERHVRTNTPGPLGYTYPNPVPTRDKLWLFWRGGNWYPSFSYTRDGVHWVAARTLVHGPKHQRPYAKYVGGSDGSIHVVLSDAHPMSYRTSLYYVRYKAGRFFRADGRLVARMHDLPLRLKQLDRIYRYRPAVGRAWPHDIALGPGGRPRIAYTARTGGPGGPDTFYLARWDGSAWRAVRHRRRRSRRSDLHQRRRHVRSRAALASRPEPHDRPLERDRGVADARRRPDVDDTDPGHQQLRRPQLPADGPSRPHRLAPRRRLRARHSQQLPQLPDRHPDGRRGRAGQPAT